MSTNVPLIGDNTLAKSSLSVTTSAGDAGLPFDQHRMDPEVLSTKSFASSRVLGLNRADKASSQSQAQGLWHIEKMFPKAHVKSKQRKQLPPGQDLGGSCDKA